MKVTATEVGVGSGDDGDESCRRGHRPFVKDPGVAGSFDIAARVSVHGDPRGGVLRLCSAGGWPALSLNGGSALLKRIGGGTVAASRYRELNWVELGPAALSGVGVDEGFEGTDERASQRRCQTLVKESIHDAGVGLGAGLK